MGGQIKANDREYGIDFAEFSQYFSARSPQPMVAVEGTTHIVRYMNDAFERLIGKDRSEVLGHTFDNAVPEGQENGCIPLLDRVYKTASPEILLEQQHSTFDPPVYWSYSVWPILGGPDQRPVGVMIQVTDVTQAVTFKKKSMEVNQQLLISSVRQHELAEIVERTAKELRFKTQELESIIGVVSHDLRAPLVNIKGFANEIRKDCCQVHDLLFQLDVPPEITKKLVLFFQQNVPESLHFIEASADSMATLVKSLVEVARVGLTVIKPETLNMDELLRGVVGNLEIKFKQAAAIITIDPLPSCFADRTMVTGIFSNLIDNAVKYLDPDRPGCISVSADRQNNRVVYCVEDNGIGIAANDQEKVFEIFTRLVEKAHASGEGMGLTMAKRMVDRNNGQISLDSEKGRGSKFFVSLPAPPPN